MTRQNDFPESQIGLHEQMQKLLLFSLAREASIDVLQKMKRQTDVQSRQLQQLIERELMQQQEEEQHRRKLQIQRERCALLVNKLDCIRQDLQLYAVLDQFTEAGHRFSFGCHHDDHLRDVKEEKATLRRLRKCRELFRLREALSQQKLVLRESVALLEAHCEEAARLEESIRAVGDEVTAGMDLLPEMPGGDADLLAVEEQLFALEAEVEASLRDLPALEGVQQQLLQQAISSIPDKSGVIPALLTQNSCAVSADSVTVLKPLSHVDGKTESARTTEGPGMEIFQHCSDSTLSYTGSETYRMRQDQFLKPRVFIDKQAGNLQWEDRTLNTINEKDSGYSSSTSGHKIAEDRIRDQGSNYAQCRVAVASGHLEPNGGDIACKQVCMKAVSRSLPAFTDVAECVDGVETESRGRGMRSAACVVEELELGGFQNASSHNERADESQKHSSSLHERPRQPNPPGLCIQKRGNVLAEEGRFQIPSRQCESPCCDIKGTAAAPDGTAGESPARSTCKQTKKAVCRMEIQSLRGSSDTTMALANMSGRLLLRPRTGEAECAGVQLGVGWGRGVDRAAVIGLQKTRHAHGSTGGRLEHCDAVAERVENVYVVNADVPPVTQMAQAAPTYAAKGDVDSRFLANKLQASNHFSVEELENLRGDVDAYKQQLTPQVACLPPLLLARRNPYVANEDQTDPATWCDWLHSQKRQSLQQQALQKGGQVFPAAKGSSDIQERPGPLHIMHCSSSPEKTETGPSPLGCSLSRSLAEDFHSSTGSGDNSPLLLSM